jgi:DNA-3-methyladenine glycosylase II
MLRTLTLPSLEAAAHELASRDRDLALIMKKSGIPPLWGRQPGFSTLVRIILEQQVSLASGRAMYRRLHDRLGGITPAAVTAFGEEGLRALGLTRQKSRYCLGLAERIRDGRIDLSEIARLPDDEGRTLLRAVPGLGPWSIDIYYLMALRRPDVWPRGDLALAAAMKEVTRMKDLPSRERQDAVAARWRPWRSVAARMLWMHYLAKGKKR